MTTISKLGIQGVRSFDHERMEVLDFEKPVTLIVGPNGSGKTTIIECLKMASAGILPPNTKNGHGFVHDPQLVHLPEVKAQIRMLFRTGAAQMDKEICVIRSLQLTNTRKGGKLKQTFKALDSVLKTQAEDGTKASLSHRCADMDTQVPELMGVSRAVLDSVIFCHQEDSSWPLQDAATVKKRFDEIFGATRYSQALKNIKDLQKQWGKETKDRRADADLSQKDVNQAQKLQSQREEKERAIDEITNELQAISEQVNLANQGTNNAEDRLLLQLGVYASTYLYEYVHISVYTWLRF
jgi:DNA repair protein RAD50